MIHYSFYSLLNFSPLSDIVFLYSKFLIPVLFACVSFGLVKIQPVHPKGNQSRVLIARTDVETETPIFWPPDAKS